MNLATQAFLQAYSSLAVVDKKELNKLRKIRDIKQAEQIEHNEFVRTMYSQPAPDAGGGLI